jgi:FkbM family methyltransferase
MKKHILLYSFFLCSLGAREYPRPYEGYFSQKGQDKFLHEQIFKNKKNGFFVEVGAHDGVSFSNSYFFETFLDWKGICVEPNAVFFEKLQKNRRCICEQYCITNIQTRMPFLKCKGYMLEMYSGLIDYIDPRHMKRIVDEAHTYGGDMEIMEVECIPFKELFRRHNVCHIDFLSLDIEGGEYQALQSIDFNEVTIAVIVVEDNFDEDTIKNFLLAHGYEYLIRIGKDNIYRFRR